QTQANNCQDFTINNCNLEGSDVVIKDVSEARCQSYCNSYFDTICSYFIYDRFLKLCQLYDNEITSEFLASCQKIGGPKDPLISSCINSQDVCRGFYEGYCDYQGSYINEFLGIYNVGDCQNECSNDGSCRYFVHDAQIGSCKIYRDDLRDCNVLLGSAQPSIDQCIGDGGSSTSTTTTTTTTTPTTTTTTTTTTTPTTTTTSAMGGSLTLHLRVTDALTNQPLYGVTIVCDTLERQSQDVTDANGEADCASLRQGDYVRVEASLDGFDNALLAYMMKSETIQNQYLGLSPEMNPSDDIRLVLNWQDESTDLDIHAIEVDSRGPTVICEVSYLEKQCNFAELNTYNNEGASKGSETITIKRQGSYLYTIFVQLYENGNGASFIKSGGSVSVFRNGQSDFRVEVPEDTVETDHYWIIGCYDAGTKEFRQFDYTVDLKPDYPTFCT
ncbi:hypothetical protein TCAL_12125, partial [Tigriopus californicus]